jgi:hypothetical protein
MDDQRKLFKELQQNICLQSPETAKVLKLCDEIASVFAMGLESCSNEMSFRAAVLTAWPNDPEGLRMASELDALRTGIANAMKYDYTELAQRFDFDCTTETVGDDTELWLHAWLKAQSV